MQRGKETPAAKEHLQEYLHSDRNPIYKAETRERASTSLRAKGFSYLNGGNGQLTVPQKLLSLALGWETEVAVSTSIKQKGISTCYKIDVADRILKVGIEIDGESHKGPMAQERDKKKAEYLASLGWKILRFKNKEVLTSTENVLNQIMEVVWSSI